MGGARNLANQRFGDLVADHPTDKRDNGSIVWSCRCLRCGSACEVSARNLVNLHTTSCGCARGKPVAKRETFGALVAIERVGTDDRGQSIWLCECECGKTCEVTGAKLRQGAATSCGCGATKFKRSAEANGAVDGTRLSLLNGKPPKNNTSGVRGVFFDKRRGRWVAQIKFQGKNRRLGSYETIEEAAEARREAEQELFDPVLEAHGLEPTSEAAYEEVLRKAVESERTNDK